jgi:hypothetical protein
MEIILLSARQVRSFHGLNSKLTIIDEVATTRPLTELGSVFIFTKPTKPVE